MSKFRPFMLDSPDQFRPGPPPALNSAAYANSYRESKYRGGAVSQFRTAEQTDIALFWTANFVPQFNNMYQAVATSRNLSPVQAARLFAMTNMVGTDAQVACWDAKYTYLAWRPQFAIPQGDTDGNPATTGDPTWKPLALTPPHPEYPAAHGCVSEAQVYALMTVLGSSNFNVDISSPVPNLMHPTRHYQTATQLINEIGNARVCGGMHFRFATGRDFGQDVLRGRIDRGEVVPAGHGLAGDEVVDPHGYWMVFMRAPRPSISVTITSPGWQSTTPSGVPVRIRSPGCSVMKLEKYSMRKGTLKIIVV
jgi:hypothetical protein